MLQGAATEHPGAVVLSTSADTFAVCPRLVQEAGAVMFTWSTCSWT